MKKLTITIIVLLLILNVACIVYYIHAGQPGMSALNGFACGTLFMSLLKLPIS